jgi:hypothetical protein
VFDGVVHVLDVVDVVDVVVVDGVAHAFEAHGSAVIPKLEDVVLGTQGFAVTDDMFALDAVEVVVNVLNNCVGFCADDDVLVGVIELNN